MTPPVPATISIFDQLTAALERKDRRTALYLMESIYDRQLRATPDERRWAEDFISRKWPDGFPTLEEDG
ncbi:MAG: hypothetical protein ACRDJE_07295 [Dehalococcoidia bacterium]